MIAQIDLHLLVITIEPHDLTPETVFIAQERYLYKSSSTPSETERGRLLVTPNRPPSHF